MSTFDTPSRLIAFDLDDTLFKERDYVESGFRYVAAEIARRYHFDYEEMIQVMQTAPFHAFDSLEEYITNRAAQQGIKSVPTVEELLKLYRCHPPQIEPSQGVIPVLTELRRRGNALAIITDGRAITQMEKVKALGLDRLVDSQNISISEMIGAEKTSRRPFERMASLNPGLDQYVYVADNPMKDFVWPNRMGWLTFEVRDNGRNVHFQNIALPAADYAPARRIDSLEPLLEYFS